MSSQVILDHLKSLEIDPDQSEACFDDLEAFLQMDGWDWMVNISRTLGADKCQSVKKF